MSRNPQITQRNIESIFKIYDELNSDMSHKTSGDDICTPMECVKTMLDYIPQDFWERENLKILDPCCGNGNFGAYCQFKTDLDNIYFNDTNPTRTANCKKILNPKNLTNYDIFGLEFAMNVESRINTESNSSAESSLNTESRTNAESAESWDLIMANPPYSGGGNKNKSLSNKFIEFAIDRLKKGGYLCFVTPNNWQTFNNSNTTLKKLLTQGSFVVLDYDVKRFFKKVGSSFVIFIWQKGVFGKTKIFNNYLLKDIQTDILIPKNLPFIPLYISQITLNLVEKLIQKDNNRFHYRCDLHNFTKKEFLSDFQSEIFRYKTIHTPLKTRFAKIKQDIYDKWLIIIPLSTYYVPYIAHNANTTQSVGYFSFDTKVEAEAYLEIITQDYFKALIHITRYGNFNNIMVLKHLRFDDVPDLTSEEKGEIEKLRATIKY